MSSSIEDEIVAMKFDNRQFESGVATSLGTIDRLKQSLQFKDAGQGLSDVQRGIANFHMGGMEGALTHVSKSWTALTTVAVTALATITSKVVNAGLNLAKSFTVQPLIDGFKEYELNLNSVQTIMANTGKDVKTVNKYLNDLNHYSDKTIYNFSQMAKNIGTFTAAGVDLKTSTASIKGIANLAALSGSSADQASNAMYQLSQAIASGKVGLQDWNSVVNAGMGGKVFQKALADTGVAMGTLNKGAVKLVGPMKQLKINGEAFRNTIAAKTADGSEPWLTSEVLTKTLTQFTGDLSKAQIMAMGFDKAQAKAIMATASTAQKAATRVKTFTQLIDVVKESIGSGWAMIFQHLFGNFQQASKLWTGVSNDITGAISHIFKSINQLLSGWAKLGGYKDLWTGIGNIFKIIGNIIGPFIDAFKTLFPATDKAGAGLAKATHGFATFTGWIEKGTRSFKVITPVLVFFFGAIKKGIGFIADAIGMLKPFVGLLADFGHYASGIVQDGASIAQGLIGGLLQGLNVGELKAAIYNFAENIVIWFKEKLGIHSPATEMIPVGYNVAAGIGVGIYQGTGQVLSAIGGFFSDLWSTIKGWVSKITLDKTLEIGNFGFLTLFYLQIRKIFGLFDSFRGVFNSASGVLNQLTSNLKTMQTKVRSEIIRNIAISIGILAASAVLLAHVDGKKLGISLGAISAMMVGLMTSMRVMMGGTKGLSVKEMAKQAGVITAMSAAMVAFSTAVLIMAGAVALLGQLDVKTIAKGLAGVAGVVAIIVASTAVLGKFGGGASIIGAAAAMVIMAVGLTAMAGVLKLYSAMDWKTILGGGVKAAGVLIALGIAMMAFNGTIAGSAALLVASGALAVLAGVMKVLATISWNDTIKGLVAMAGAMIIMAAAATAMTFAEGGAASMLVMAGAVVVLAQGIKMLSKIPFLSMLKALGILALVFAGLAAAAILLGPILPILEALGVVLLTFAGAIALLGVGMFAFASGLALMATVGQAGFAVLVAGITSFLGLLPVLITQFGLSINAMLDILEVAGPRFVHIIGLIVIALLDELLAAIPKLTLVAVELIGAFFTVLFVSRFRMVAVALALLLALVDGLSEHIGELVDAAVRLIQRFADAITGHKNMEKIGTAAGEILSKFLSALGSWIHDHWNEWVEKGKEIGDAIAEGISSAIEDALRKIPGVDWANKNLDPSKLWGGDNWVQDFVDQNTPKNGQTGGIPDMFGETLPKKTTKSSSDLGKKAADSMRSGFNKEVDTTPPKVAPVLDLSTLQKQIPQIEGALPKPKLKADESRQQAKDVAAAQVKSGDHKVEKNVVINYKQEIKSKDPIDHVKVYRSTKSGLALVKEEVKSKR